jgi:hypothetical protein
MTRLLLCALLMTLPASCGSNYPVAAPVEPCAVPAFPAPLDVSPVGCGEWVCWTVADTVEFVRWEQAVNEYWRAVTICPFVEVE